MNTESALFPLYQLMDAFEAFTHGEPSVKPQHRSLYYFLLGYARKRGNVPRFTMPYETGMHGSTIGSWTTYDAALRALQDWGFIRYTPGANRYKVPIVELTFRNPNGDELLSNWQSYCLAHSLELQNQSSIPAVSPEVELHNRRSTDNSTHNSNDVELQNCRSTDNSTANPSGDIKKTLRPMTDDDAAEAATHSSIFKKSTSTRAQKKERKLPATLAEIAALVLPHLGSEFRDLWATFTTTNTKQTKKPLSAFELMLKKLGGYPEAFAVVMLESAIQGDWSGVENTGTPRAFAEWEQQQTRRPQPSTPPSRIAGPAPVVEPELNPNVVAERHAKAQADAEERNRRFRATLATPLA